MGVAHISLGSRGGICCRRDNKELLLMLPLTMSLYSRSHSSITFPPQLCDLASGSDSGAGADDAALANDVVDDDNGVSEGKGGHCDDSVCSCCPKNPRRGQTPYLTALGYGDFEVYVRVLRFV